MLEQITGKSLDKSEQLSDWNRRPLRQSQIDYAGRVKRFMSPDIFISSSFLVNSYGCTLSAGGEGASVPDLQIFGSQLGRAARPFHAQERPAKSASQVTFASVFIFSLFSRFSLFYVSSCREIETKSPGNVGFAIKFKCVLFLLTQ